MSDNLLVMLGEIKGKLDMVVEGQERLDKKLDKFDTRVGRVERSAAKQGMVTGAIAALGISLIKQKFGL